MKNQIVVLCEIIFHAWRALNNFRICSLPQRGSVGDRFFTSGWQLSLMKRMKKRLTDTADHYRQLAARCAAGTSSEPEDQPVASISTRDFCEKLEKFVSFCNSSSWGIFKRSLPEI